MCEGCVKDVRSEEHTSELQSHLNIVCRLLLEKKNNTHATTQNNTRNTHHTHRQQHADSHTQTHTQRETQTHTQKNIHTHTHIFFLNDTATTEIYTLPLHDALPISLHPSPLLLHFPLLSSSPLLLSLP